MIRYLPVTGTGAKHAWHLDGSPFVEFMRSEGLEPLRNEYGAPLFQWDGKLHGLWWQGADGWKHEALKLRTALKRVDYEDRNIVAHSHGGQLCTFLAASGFPIRTLTTIGTPVRSDVPAKEAAKHILYWQHIHDQKRDWMATLKRIGALGDWDAKQERRFMVPGVVNIGLKDIGHSDLLSDPASFYMWRDHFLLDGIRHER